MAPPVGRLFTAHTAAGRLLYKLYFLLFTAGIASLLYYRLTRFFSSEHPLLWSAVTAAEFWFAAVWVFQQGFRWAPTFFETHVERLPADDLPPVDILVCTADPVREPPDLVANTLLSLMASEYDARKLSYYVSDDGGSELTFLGVYLASIFAKEWLPFCRKYRVETPAPEEYFFKEENGPAVGGAGFLQDYSAVKGKFEDMKAKIAFAVEKGRVPDEVRKEHKGFKEWSSKVIMTPSDHQSIVEVLSRGNGVDMDADGNPMPTLVYVSREKRPDQPHHYKAGALNALNRVSSVFSNAPFLMNFDCDMIANNREGLLHSMCFFLDPDEGRQIAYVQFPQAFRGITENDIYSNGNKRTFQIEFFGTNAHCGPMFAGTNSAARRDVINGMKFTNDYRPTVAKSSAPGDMNWSDLEKKAREVATCNSEAGKPWGTEMGMMYGCAVEDVYTGLAMHSRGWRSVCFSPKRVAYLGLGPTNTNDTLIQHKRWSTGLMEIFSSEYCPWTHGLGRLKLGQIMCYSFYTLWALWCFPILCYAVVPPLAMVNGISLFPKVSDPWFKVFAFLAVASHAFSLGELLRYGGTVRMWVNETRMWMLKGTSSYLFSVVVMAAKLLGAGDPGFEITSKVVDGEARERYEREVMEFGVASPMFVPFAALSLLNLFALLKTVAAAAEGGWAAGERFALQVAVSGFASLMSLPLYSAMFWRRDKGRMPTSVTLLAVVIVAGLVYLF